MFTWLSTDGKIIFINRALRSFAFGFISIIIGIYLKEIGVNSLLIGLLLSASLLGGALFTLVVGHFAPAYGIKKMFLVSLLVSLIGIVIFIITQNYIFLILASLIAFMSPSGRELGPFLSLEQAYLPSAVSGKNRAKAFSYFNIVGGLSGSLGALLGALPLFLQKNLGLGAIMSYKALFILYLILNLVAFFLYLRLSEIKFEQTKVKMSDESRKKVTKLALLFGIDSFAGGMILNSIIALWFHTKFNMPLSVLSPLFFAAGLLEVFSFYLSGKLAEKIGLLKTMVFTHIPSNLFLIFIPFMPTFPLAALAYFLRQGLSEMDIPARQAYVVSVVSAEERSRAASITNVSKIVASSISPPIASRILLSAVSPFILAGVLKIFYDLTLYHNFKHAKLLEE